MFTIRDGRIARKDVYSDSVTILPTVGLLTLGSSADEVTNSAFAMRAPDQIHPGNT